MAPTRVPSGLFWPRSSPQSRDQPIKAAGVVKSLRQNDSALNSGNHFFSARSRLSRAEAPGLKRQCERFSPTTEERLNPAAKSVAPP